MATIQISQREFDDFMEEADTEPVLLLLVEDQINSAKSVAGSFAGKARSLAPDPTEAVPLHWTERLLLDDDAIVDVTDEVEVLQ